MGKTERKVQEFVEKYRMIQKGDRIVAGISGGADSVCLLYLMKELQKIYDFSIIAVHVNHQLREGEAVRDEEFVRELCSREKVPFYACHVDVEKIAQESGISLEEAGRNARYEIFSQICRKESGNKIALAHHQDDLAETMLHHLARGTGAAGLCSLKPVYGNRIRPLLCMTRQEVESYLEEKKISWQTDSTNLDDHYTRNKIRHHVVDYLCREINSQTVSHMAQTAEELGEIQDFLEKLAEEKMKKYCRKQGKDIFLSESLRKEEAVISRRIILRVLKEVSGKTKDFTREHVEMICRLWEKQVGKQVYLPYQITGERMYEGVLIGRNEAKQLDRPIGICPECKQIPLEIPGVNQVGKYFIECQVLSREETEDKFLRIPEKTYTKWLNYDRIENSLVFRHRQSGDRFSAHPSGGSKKLKDYLIDRKIPRQERDFLGLLAEGNEILWIIGDRISQKYKVSEETRHILHIQIKGGDIHE